MGSESSKMATRTQEKHKYLWKYRSKSEDNGNQEVKTKANPPYVEKEDRRILEDVVTVYPGLSNGSGDANAYTVQKTDSLKLNKTAFVPLTDINIDINKGNRDMSSLKTPRNICLLRSFGTASSVVLESGDRRPKTSMDCKSAFSDSQRPNYLHKTRKTQMNPVSEINKKGQFSCHFWVPVSGIRAFTGSQDRRLESIARSCGCTIKLMESIKSDRFGFLERQAVIRSTSTCGMEKCRNLIDVRFPEFSVKGFVVVPASL